MGRHKASVSVANEERNIIQEAARELYAYIKANKKNLPEYWHDKGAPVCIEGICCMIARGKHTDEEIAEYYECHVSVVDMVRVARKKTIEKFKQEHEEMLEAFGEVYENTTFKNADQEGVLRLLEYIVGGRSYED